MENKFQTSFIPKRSLDQGGSSRPKTPFNLLHICSMTLFIAALVATAGIFGYSYLLERQVEKARTEVAAKEKNFNYAVVQEIVDFDNQLKAASTILKNHTAASALFTVLEENTLVNLRFTDFEFSYLSPSRVALSMKGTARSFGAVARQAEVFSTASSTRSYFHDPIFSDLNLDEKGNVNFTFLTTIDPELLAYKADEADSATTTNQ